MYFSNLFVKGPDKVAASKRRKPPAHRKLHHNVLPRSPGKGPGRGRAEGKARTLRKKATATREGRLHLKAAEERRRPVARRCSTLVEKLGIAKGVVQHGDPEVRVIGQVVQNALSR